MQNPRNTELQAKIDPSVSTDSNKPFYPAAPLPNDVGMVLQLADGSIQGCNSHAQELLGMTAQQMLSCTSINSLRHTLREDGSDFPGDTHPAMVALQTGQPCSNVIMGFYPPDRESIGLVDAQFSTFISGR